MSRYQPDRGWVPKWPRPDRSAGGEAPASVVGVVGTSHGFVVLLGSYFPVSTIVLDSGCLQR